MPPIIDAGKCTACNGSLVMELTDDQYQRRVAYKKAERKRLYTDTEKAIMRIAPTAKAAHRNLLIAGYVDRTHKGVIRWRTKNGIRRSR